MQRIDNEPTHTYGGYELRAGKPLPLGATAVPNGVNFSVFSRHARSCALVLFEKGAAEPLVEIPFAEEFRLGHIFAMTVFGLDYENIEYGYRMTGPFRPHEGHRFNDDRILLDPLAKIIHGREQWGVEPNYDDIFPHRGALLYDDFEWGDDRPLNIPTEDLIIYEMHVRGFTQHFSSGVKYPGTFAAIREKIPYLKRLGINCIELMPIFEFDEFDNIHTNPLTGERLLNYWGYSSIGFFAPKAGYAATGKHGMQVDELKALIRELHRNGIEVILDVVYNHTAEGDERGHTISFRGIDNKTYYMLTPDGRYLNFSGTGNTLNCNNPVVRELVIDSLRYWVSEYHIDGFRFDLASILGRDQNGMPLANPPVLESLANDPILANCKLIAEAWDAGGMYQVGSFPAYGRWAEWNGQYRDVIRRFIKGDDGVIWQVANRIQGSPDMYWERGPSASINFITAHDGFTLHDLVAYNEKRNLANGENNMDGANDNYSWNCGVEGETDDEGILTLRNQQMKNFITVLMVSQGVPMILMGDEVAHTKGGNNNTYGHDNALNWLDWTRTDHNREIFNFTRQMIAFRRAHHGLRRSAHFSHRDRAGSGYPDISWHGVRAWQPEWSHFIRTLAFMLDGDNAMRDGAADDSIYVAINTHWEAHWFEIPALPSGRQWWRFADTARRPPEDIYTPGNEILLKDQHYVQVAGRSVVVLVGR